jgi:predicted RND superfamily exporter protein
MLRRYVNWIVGRPKTVIAVIVAVTLVLGFFISRVKVNIDIDAQIPTDHPLVTIGKRVEKLFGGKYLTIIGFYPAEGTVYTPKVLAKVKRVTDAVEAMPGVKKGTVLSLMSPRVKDFHSTEEALEITPLASKVPETEAEIAAFRERVKANAFLTSLFVSEDGRATSVLVDYDDFEKAGGAKDLWKRLEKIIGPEREPGLEIISAGAASISYWLTQYTLRVAGLFLLALAIIAFLQYRAFRTLQGMFIPLVTAILCVIWSLGMVGVIGALFDPWNSMTPILLLAIAAGHSVQILKRYYEEYNRSNEAHPELPPIEHNRRAVIEATVKVGIVMLAAGTIASLSFGSLAAFGLPSIKTFGLCTAFGILAALIIEMTFIPAVRVLLTPPSPRQTAREKRQEYFDPILEKLASVIRNKREKPILWVFIILIVFAVVGVFQINTRNNLAAQFFESNAPIRGFRMADKYLAGTRVIQVLLEGNAPNTIKNPDILRRMDELSTFISKQPLPIGKIQSFVDFFKQISLALDPGVPPKLPDSEEAVAQLLLLYSMGGDEDDLTRLVDRDFQNAVITIFLKTDDYNDMKALTVATTAEAKRLFAGTAVNARVGGGVTNAIALNETMVRGKTINLIQIAILVVIITSVLLRSIVAGFLILLPLATAALVNLGLMGWTGISLSLGTAAISAMAIGIGADYAVYFVFRVREELQRCGDLRQATVTALTTSGKAIAYVATAVGAGYLCLAFSGFKVHVQLGLLVALTMVTSSAATVAFLPAVLLRVNPGFIKRQKAETVTTETQS